jgi:hypothetical protein
MSDCSCCWEYKQTITIPNNQQRKTDLVQYEKVVGFHTLNLVATEENLYDDLEDSSGSEGKRPDTKGQFEEENRLQCSTTT